MTFCLALALPSKLLLHFGVKEIKKGDLGFSKIENQAASARYSHASIVPFRWLKKIEKRCAKTLNE